MAGAEKDEASWTGFLKTQILMGNSTCKDPERPWDDVFFPGRSPGSLGHFWGEGSRKEASISSGGNISVRFSPLRSREPESGSEGKEPTGRVL